MTQAKNGNGKQYGGWAVEGIHRFNELVTAIIDSREKKEDNKKLEDLLIAQFQKIEEARVSKLQRRPKNKHTSIRANKDVPRCALPKSMQNEMADEESDSDSASSETNGAYDVHQQEEV